jgi:hypothetical protein
MVIVHPSRSKYISTRSAEAFRGERIAGLLIWIIAAKDTILAAEAFSIVLSFFYLRKSRFLIDHRMIRSRILAKSN